MPEGYRRNLEKNHMIHAKEGVYMNKECLIRRAEYEDIPAIMEFIDKYWKKDHILAKSRYYFEYQHYYNGEVSFVIAEEPVNKELEGILGYIVYSEKAEERDLFGVIWKVRSNNYPMLGMKIQLFAMRNLGARSFSGIGLNQSTLNMHKRWGASLGKLKQYYILADKEKYNIAKVEKANKAGHNTKLEQFVLRRMVDEEGLLEICEMEKRDGKIPRKSAQFVKHRYFSNPVYTYVKYGVYRGKNIQGILISREIECNSSKVLRIVDYLGNVHAIAHIGKGLKDLLLEKGYEYIDFYLYGIDDQILIDAGFVERDESDKNVIPSYFEPFVQENVDLDFYTTSKDDVILFKGDGDQDRPNAMNE